MHVLLSASASTACCDLFALPGRTETFGPDWPGGGL